jgi:hypothetical protein
VAKEITPFDFMTAASFSKEDLIGDNENPEYIEKMYTPFMVNRGFSNFQDTILHANEMNQRPDLFGRAQFDYYRAVLRKGKRFSKWPKATKDKDLDALQIVYECNRVVAKQYFNALSAEDMKTVHDKLIKGGA